MKLEDNAFVAEIKDWSEKLTSFPSLQVHVENFTSVGNYLVRFCRLIGW